MFVSMLRMSRLRLEVFHQKQEGRIVALQPQTLWRSPTTGGGTAETLGPTENEQALGSESSLAVSNEATYTSSECLQQDRCVSEQGWHLQWEGGGTWETPSGT